MELKFNKNGDAWVAEFEATDKFNLHMEGLLLGSFSILQRTAGGKYTHVRDIPTYPRFDKVFDYDFNALVYPKFIKIVSEIEPTYAEVVSDGEITEIKSQTKEVEVTANGTTQVAPDAGYSYLTGVTVKTNVPQSGGSGGGEGEEVDCLEYVDTSNPDFMALVELGVMSHVVKLREDDGTIVIAPPCQALLNNDAIDGNRMTKIIAIGLYPKVRMKGGILGEIGYTVAEIGGELLANAPHITKEQFYTI